MWQGKRGFIYLKNKSVALIIGRLFLMKSMFFVLVLVIDIFLPVVFKKINFYYHGI